MKKFLISLACLFCATSSFAFEMPAKTLIAEAQQLVVITTDDWQAINGQMQLYERNPTTLRWQAVGPKTPIVVGRGGMGWGIEIQGYGYPGPIKVEKDYRTPAGVYKVGPAFGYPRQAPLRIKLAYMPVDDTYFCNDNSGKDYNTLIFNKEEPIRTEWRDVELFRWGAIIQYNMAEPIQNAGSCVLLHIWESPNIGTKGCVAMSVEHLEVLIKWLDPNKKPVIVILPKKEYNKLRQAWGLPPLSWTQRLMYRVS
ncbi:MAG TPA: L,D-transpeptidase family protein [Coxiellaceae bacterium]|nr:L,D-transpeptidase family protein [Coxiellaceae bacterium]